MPKMQQINWPGWETVQLIGRGSYGAVYEIQRNIRGRTEHAALKVISIPQNESEIRELRAEGYDDESVTQYFADSLEKIENEYAMMADLKGHSNVVYCDDIRTVQHDDGFGWDIYIKMELLTPLKSYLGDGANETQVIKLGSDICDALILCEELNIVHRDIKPENIFVSRSGDFKLGDFGIAKTMEGTTGGTKTGTYDYMAPEVYNNLPYHSQADIYSLGLVMYWLLNNRTAPFLPQGGKKPTPSEKSIARDRRFSGEKIPAPLYGSKQLQEIVLKACAYDPIERYQSAREMREELVRLSGGQAAKFIAEPKPTPILDVQDGTDDNKTVGPIFKHTTAVDTDGLDKTVGPVFTPRGEQEQQRIAQEQAARDEWEHIHREKEESDKGGRLSAHYDAKKKKNAILWSAVAAVLFAILIGYMTIHISTEATCTQDPICKICGKVTGRALGHNWGEATCVSPRTCITCGTQEGAALGHNWGEATCVSPRTCITCGTKEGSALGHNWEEATCVSPRKCVTCGTTEGSALGHSWAEATYEQPSTCVRCGETTGDAKTNIMSQTDCIAAGGLQSVIILPNGTALASGDSRYGACNVTGWTDLVAVSSGDFFTVGLRKDGTVLAAGDNQYGQCNVTGWHNIVAIAAGDFHTIGLQGDGTVVAVGDNRCGQCNVAALNTGKKIIAVAASWDHTAVLYADGTAAATGDNSFGECNVSGWQNIVAIYAGANFTVGLRSDGTVVATGKNDAGQCAVTDWINVVMLSAGDYHTVAVTKEGRILSTGMNTYGQRNFTGWNNIVAIGAGCYHTVAITADGRILSTGRNYEGQCDISKYVYSN